MKKTSEDKINEILNIEVDEYSTPCTVCCKESDSLATVVEMMKEFKVRHVPVIKDGPIGIISDRDIKNISSDSRLTAGDVMVKNLYIVKSGTLLQKVVFSMAEKKIGSTIVLNDKEEANDFDNNLSIFTLTDALNALNEILRGELL